MTRQPFLGSRRRSVRGGQRADNNHEKGIWEFLRVNGISVLSLLITATISIFTIVNSHNLQREANEAQFRIKQYEITFSQKQQLYTRFMLTVDKSFESSIKYDPSCWKENIDNLKSTYYNIEPYLSEADKPVIWQRVQNYEYFCTTTRDNAISGVFRIDDKDPGYTENVDNFVECRDEFREKLTKALFR